MEVFDLATRTEVAPNPREMRDAIDHLEGELRQMPQLEVEPTHTFGPGFYARTIRLPAGATLVGKIHETEHVFIVSEGEILLASEDGARRVKAPFQTISRAGTKRAGHVIADCVVTNVHITTETDVALLEAALIRKPALAAPQEH